MSGPSFDPGLTQQFGGKLRRTINPDGSFNVSRSGYGIRDAGVYLFLMNRSWPVFLTIVGIAYILAGFAFALIYWLIGVDSITGADHSTPMNALRDAFFFSVQTFTTVGYGHMSPNGTLTSFVAAMEALSGLLGLAVGTGLLYGRFSKPSAKLIFSENMVVAPFQGGRALMFRVANRRPNVLMEIEARVLLMTVVNTGGKLKREYAALALERPTVYFLPLTWTLVHPINEASPFWGKTDEDMRALQSEAMVLIKSFDDTFGQTVHARRSYIAEEIVWNARFEPAFEVTPDGDLNLNLDRVGAYARLPDE
jgi:inward rectifier potassium channel